MGFLVLLGGGGEGTRAQAAWRGRNKAPIPALHVTQSKEEWRGSQRHPELRDTPLWFAKDNFQLKPGQLVALGTPKGGPLFSILKAEMEEAPAAPRFPERTYTQWIFTHYCLYQTRHRARQGSLKPPRQGTLGLWNKKSLPQESLRVTLEF